MNIFLSPHCSTLLALLASVSSVQAFAANLDATATKVLTNNRMWQQPQAHGSGQLFWAWKSDGTVCLRTDGKTSKCADTGKWKLEGDRLCYELTWWGKSSGRNSACFRVHDRGKGKYEAIQDNGLELFHFSVLQ
jgi:hypothetical protein